MSRVIRGLAALVALLLVLVGVPAALVVLGGNPLPHTLSWVGLRMALLTPDDGTILLGLITVLAWVAWLVLAVSVLVELVTVLSHQRIHLRLPGLGGPQRIAAGLLLAVGALITVPQLAHAPAPLPTVSPPLAPSPTVSPPDGAGVVASGTPSPGSEFSGGAYPDGPLAPLTSPSGQATDSGETHVVKSGDDLWSLAEHYYGQGRDWRRIAAANPGVLTGGPDRLEPGWRLSIPEDRASTTGGGAQITVERGDSLSTIAEAELGSAARWPSIYDLNRAQLSDPNELTPGMELELPATTEPGPEADLGDRRDDRRSSGAGSEGEPVDRDGPARPVPTTPAPGSPPWSPTAPAPPVPAPPVPAPPVPAPSVPAPPVPTPPVPTPTAPVPSVSAQAPVEDASVEEASTTEGVFVPLVAVGGLLAAGLIAGLAVRRRLQLQTRPVGRRIPQPPAPAQLVEAAMGRRQRPVNLRTLDRASRAIAAHCRSAGTTLPELQYALVGGQQIELVLAQPRSDAPVGFIVRGRSWLLDQADSGYLSTVPGLGEAPRPWPALATLGRDARDRLVVADLETMGLLGLQSPEPEVSEGVLAALAIELSFSPWADEMILTLVDDDCDDAGAAVRARRLPEALGRHNVGRTSDVDRLLDRLEKRAVAQRTQLAQIGLGRRRTDPDLVDPWAPEIVLVGKTLEADQWSRLIVVLTAEPRVPIAAVVVDPAGTTPWRFEARAAAAAVLQPVGMELVPQHLDPPAASAVVDLIDTTGSEATTAAPWWDQGGPLPSRQPTGPPPDNVTFLGKRFGGWGLDVESTAEDDPGQAAGPETSGRAGEQTSGDIEAADDTTRAEGARMRTVAAVLAGEIEPPVLRLLGPVELVGSTGSPPPRAGKQCLEYCAWLLEHPGTTAQAMASALVVAEGTRRSNMSRLRSWLGHDPAGEPYLPDAYTGRIVLHPGVSSDWLHLQVLTTGGVNRAGSEALQAALDLVRGAPLADAAPGQWHWAEELRTDMVSCLRDIGVELANRALDRGELDLARWAASRALVAAPGDELLMAARIRTEHRAGNPAETERLTLQLAAQARSLGVDLEVETVILMQQVMEGRVRARMA